MKRFLLFFIVMLTSSCVLASDDATLAETSAIEARINSIGVKILNANKIDKRVVFVYSKKDRSKLLKGTEALTKRQVVVYQNDYKNIETDDELAAYVAEQIPAAARSYQGGTGFLSSVKMKAAPKKYELVFDKLAVDYMVKAGYNPLGLITWINKSCPQARQDKLSHSNLTSKRLALIYERIYMKYPSFLAKNTYIQNEYYQNFLLTSQENRKILQEKIQNKDWKRELKYE